MKHHIFAYCITSRETRNSKASNISKTRGKEEKIYKNANFPKYISPSYYSIEKSKEKE